MKRYISINDGSNRKLELSKAVSIKTEKEMIHFDKLKDGTWRLTYNGNVIPLISNLRSLDMIREE